VISDFGSQISEEYRGGKSGGPEFGLLVDKCIGL
jgi:hypothetical protein